MRAIVEQTGNIDFEAGVGLPLTRNQAIDLLVVLDRYWSEDRTVVQRVGRMTAENPCGCFGAHCALAMKQKSSTKYRYLDRTYHETERQREFYEWEFYEFQVGVVVLFSIVDTLGIPGTALLAKLRELTARTTPFGEAPWLQHPTKTWPAISRWIRREAGLALVPA